MLANSHTFAYKVVMSERHIGPLEGRRLRKIHKLARKIHVIDGWLKSDTSEIVEGVEVKSGALEPVKPKFMVQPKWWGEGGKGDEVHVDDLWDGEGKFIGRRFTVTHRDRTLGLISTREVLLRQDGGVRYVGGGIAGVDRPSVYDSEAFSVSAALGVSGGLNAAVDTMEKAYDVQFNNELSYNQREFAL